MQLILSLKLVWFSPITCQFSTLVNVMLNHPSDAINAPFNFPHCVLESFLESVIGPKMCAPVRENDQGLCFQEILPFFKYFNILKLFSELQSALGRYFFLFFRFYHLVRFFTVM